MADTIFISYRRQDSSPSARGLRDELRRVFKNPVFFDSEEIGIGDVWSSQIRNALDSTAVLIIVIGPTWLRISDEYGRRRIDNYEDWVNIELRECIGKKISIIPVLVNHGLMPPREGLPREIRDITNFQYFEIRDDFWHDDLQRLIDKLRENSFLNERSEESLLLPTYASTPKHLPGALTDAEISEVLVGLPLWKLVISPMPGNYPKQRVEISRRYSFIKFSEAIEFMDACVPVVNEMRHHPRWQNVFRTVDVWLSTWDIGSRISHLDVELAKAMDNIFEQIYSRN